MILLTRFLIENFYDKIKLSKKYFIATTLVSTPMMSKIAKDYGIECKLTLTGFKWIAKLIEDYPDQKIICGGEESYGFMIGDLVRDKDAITSTLLACNLGSYLKQTGSSIFEFLIESYIKHGYFKEKMISVTKKGKKGLNEILKIMKFYRESPPDKISNLKIKIIEDYLVRKEKNINNKKSKKINFPKSDFIRFILEDNSIISIRPSGTEPKVKFYISVRHKLNKKEDYFKIDMLLEDKIKRISNGLKIN
jgi:phosphoglucomutase